MKGIILAGGSGTRLFPTTIVVAKSLLPVYDKPMIFFPLATLLSAGIRDILVIAQPETNEIYRRLLQHGESLGASIRYASQLHPAGIADALRIATREQFGGDYDRYCLVLGDNLFHGDGLAKKLQAESDGVGACIFAYAVRHPERYGVVEFSGDQPVALEEKPRVPRSSWAVTGLYCYPGDVLHVAAGLRPSARGELEITDVNKHYLESGRLRAVQLGRGYAWLDTGTPEDLLAASQYVQTVQERQGIQIGCPHEEAWRQGWLTSDSLREIAEREFPGTSYGKYLSNLSLQAV